MPGLGSQSPNQREGLSAISSITGNNEYIYSTNHALDVNATVSISGSPIPISGATTAIATAIVDGSGNQITSFGGGVQYTEGDVDATPTGTVALWRDDNDNSLHAASQDEPLPIKISAADVVVPISDSAGNPLASTSSALNVDIQNPSLNVDASGTVLQLISGESGIEGNAGAVTAKTVRVAIATNANAISGTVTAAAQPGIDIGDVTVNNASGAAAVNIQDGGNSITVDGTVSITANSAVNLAQVGGTNTVTAGVNGTQAIGGNQATNNNVSSNVNPILIAGSDYGGTPKIQNWKVDGSGIGQVSVTNSSIAVTQSTSPWIVAGGGTAGSAATGVVTVQGITSMTPLLVTPAANSAVNVAQLAGTTTDTNSGNKSAGTLRVVIATDQPQLTNALKVDGSGVTQPVSYATTGSGTATGALRVELPTNGTGVVGLNAGTNNVGQVSVAPQTANGLSVFNATSSDGATALTNSAQAIKASAGQLYGWYIYNPNATAQFVQLYNTAAASVTVGTTNPLFMLTIPAMSGANVEFTNGITFSNAGWSAAATSTAGGNGAPGTALDAVFFYK
jgi:hypothetical protein